MRVSALLHKLRPLWLIVGLTCLTSGLVEARDSKRSAPIKGTALTLYFELPELGMSYEQLLWELSREGFTHVSVVVQWAQQDTRSVELTSKHTEATPDEVLKRVIHRAHALGLKVLLFPIIWVERRAEGEWRGKLSPRDPARWWLSYRKMIAHYTALASELKVWGLSVGSELSSLESDERQWRSLIQEVRAQFTGVLTYSANWDHYDQVPFWDALDLIGISAYYELADDPHHTRETLRRRWAHVRWALHDWHERSGLRTSLLFTELGYPSHEAGAVTPWHDHASDRVSLKTQEDSFWAFRETWADDTLLAGAFLWTWWGLGGPHDAWYTLRGKPALREVRRWIGDKLPRSTQNQP